MTEDEYLMELARVERIQTSYESADAPLWLHMLGWADCEVEKRLLKEEKLNG